MSQENVETVRDFIASWNAKNTHAVLELLDADVDYYPVRKFSEARPCHGREEFWEFVVQFGEAFSQSDWALRSITEVGDDRVLACANLRAEGRESRVKLEGDVYACFWLRHGRIFREEDHLTLSGALHALGLEGEALEAVGLSEQDAHADS